MTNGELRLISRLLQMADDVFSNHGCNDLFSDFWDEVGMSAEEQSNLLKEMQEWNGDKESPWPQRIEQIRDSSLMGFYSYKLARATGECENGGGGK